MIRYRFYVEQPVNQDMYVLKLLRYDGTLQQVLTNHGWHTFQEWDMLTDLPAISGADMVMQRSVERALSEWTNTIRESINAPS